MKRVRQSSIIGEKDRIQKLLEQRKSNKEIADILGTSYATVAIFVRRHLGGNPYKTKHKHLREPVMKYFLKHTAQETICKFKLTSSEFKSIMTVGYKMPEFAHLRKDTRMKEPYTLKSLLLLFQLSGFVQRDCIAKAIGRSNSRVIKEKMQNLGLNSTKNMNGITFSQYVDVFGDEPKQFIRTQAGPFNSLRDYFFRLVLWSDIDNWLKDGLIRTDDVMNAYVSAMATFQRWFFKTENIKPKVKRLMRKYGRQD